MKNKIKEYKPENLIFIADDECYEKLKTHLISDNQEKLLVSSSSIKELLDRKKANSGKSTLIASLGVLPASFFPPALLISLPIVSYHMARSIAIDIKDIFTENRNKKGINQNIKNIKSRNFIDQIEIIRDKDIPKEIRFINHGCQSNAAYLSHPYKKNFYIPLNIYEDELNKEKKQEFLNILNLLGATKIKYENVYYKESLAKSAVESSLLGSANADLESNNSKDIEDEEAYEQTNWSINKFNSAKDSLVWFPHIEEWQNIAKKREDGELKTKKFTLTLNEASSISASLNVAEELLRDYGSISTKADQSLKRCEKIHYWIEFV